MKKILLSAFACSCLLFAQAQQNISIEAASINPPQKLLIAETSIARFYVDPVNEDKMVEDAIRAMLQQLDPHSTYSTPEETKALKESLQGNFDGVGVQFNMVEDTLYVIQPVVGGPSERVGILAGDRIVTVNDTAIAGVKMSRETIMKKLRGPRDTQVKLGVVRRGVPGIMYFNVTRAKIDTKSVEVAYMATKRVGYMRINSFGATTHDEFVAALASLQKKGMKDLILDLQGNGGGYLKAATDIANEFLNKGQEIVYTQGRVQSRYDHIAQGGGRFTKGRVVVLVDETTASAAEILSGAIQDWDRGLIIGRRTFGKGLVQNPVELPDGSMIRLTIARYYTPSGRCIQRSYKDKKEYENDLINRYNHGELMNKDSIHLPDSLKYETLNLKRTVYGGGGIMPDYFIGLDTTLYTKYHRDMVNKGIIINTSLRYIDKNRKQLKASYPTFEKFEKDFEVPQATLDEMRAAGEKDSVRCTQEIFEKSLPKIKMQLKSLIARDLWDMNEYYRVFNGSNEVFLKGLELIQAADYDKEFIQK